MFEFFKSSRFTHYLSGGLVSELPDEYILATYEYPDGKHVLYISGNFEWIENEK